MNGIESKEAASVVAAMGPDEDPVHIGESIGKPGPWKQFVTLADVHLGSSVVVERLYPVSASLCSLQKSLPSHIVEYFSWAGAGECSSKIAGGELHPPAAQNRPEVKVGHEVRYHNGNIELPI